MRSNKREPPSKDAMKSWVKGHLVYRATDELRVSMRDKNGDMVTWRGERGEMKRPRPKLKPFGPSVRAKLEQHKIPTGAKFDKQTH